MSWHFARPAIARPERGKEQIPLVASRHDTCREFRARRDERVALVMRVAPCSKRSATKYVTTFSCAKNAKQRVVVCRDATHQLEFGLKLNTQPHTYTWPPDNFIKTLSSFEQKLIFMSST